MCIADMILNKVASTSMIIESSIQDNPESSNWEKAQLALKSLDELTGWIKFLQIAHDLRETIDLFNNGMSKDRRKEIRYPFPEIYQKYIGLHIEISEAMALVELVNFSSQGMQFKSPAPLAAGSTVKGVFFTTHHPIKKEVSFTATVMHCAETDGGFNIGVQIAGSPDESSLNFFRHVHDFVVMSLTDNK
jgi:hypothetical protein